MGAETSLDFSYWYGALGYDPRWAGLIAYLYEQGVGLYYKHLKLDVIATSIDELWCVYKLKYWSCNLYFRIYFLEKPT